MSDEEPQQPVRRLPVATLAVLVVALMLVPATPLILVLVGAFGFGLALVARTATLRTATWLVVLAVLVSSARSLGAWAADRTDSDVSLTALAVPVVLALTTAGVLLVRSSRRSR